MGKLIALTLLYCAAFAQYTPPSGSGGSIPSTTSTLKGDGSGGASAVAGTATSCVLVNGSSGACASGPGVSASQPINIAVSQGVLDQWSAVVGEAWATVSPASGIAVALPDVVANCSVSPVGSYNDTISVYSTTVGVMNSPQTVSLSLTVAPRVSFVAASGQFGNAMIH